MSDISLPIIYTNTVQEYDDDECGEEAKIIK